MMSAGESISTETILGIAGTNDNVFSVTDFESLAGEQAVCEALRMMSRLAVRRSPKTRVALKMEAEDVAIRLLWRHRRGGCKTQKSADGAWDWFVSGSAAQVLRLPPAVSRFGIEKIIRSL